MKLAAQPATAATARQVKWAHPIVHIQTWWQCKTLPHTDEQADSSCEEEDGDGDVNEPAEHELAGDGPQTPRCSEDTHA